MPTTPADVADVLDKLGTVLELEHESPFRVRAYRNAADTIRMLEPPLAEMLAEGRDLTELQDVGAGIAKKIAEICALGHERFLERLELDVGPGLFRLMSLPGLGPKKVRVLRAELAVTSIEGLEAAIGDGRVAGLAGFGEKTIAGLLARIARLKEREAQADE
jgi:DNA polymerase (family 10)